MWAEFDVGSTTWRMRQFSIRMTHLESTLDRHFKFEGPLKQKIMSTMDIEMGTEPDRNRRKKATNHYMYIYICIYIFQQHLSLPKIIRKTSFGTTLWKAHGQDAVRHVWICKPPPARSGKRSWSTLLNTTTSMGQLNSRIFCRVVASPCCSGSWSCSCNGGGGGGGGCCCCCCCCSCCSCCSCCCWKWPICLLPWFIAVDNTTITHTAPDQNA